MSDKIKLNLVLSADKMSTCAGRQELLDKLNVHLDRVAPIVLNESEDLDDTIRVAWNMAEEERHRDESRRRNKLQREHDRIKAELDKRLDEEREEKYRRQKQAIDDERRLNQFLESKFSKHIDKDVIEALLQAYVHGAEDWEFSRYEFVSHMQRVVYERGLHDTADEIADRIASVVTLA